MERETCNSVLHSTFRLSSTANLNCGCRSWR